MSNLVGFGSDGASVMTGRHNGVASKIKQAVGHVFAIHCVAHRLALASGDAADKVDYLVTFASTLRSLHSYIHHSSVRMESLAAWQEAFSEPILTVKRPCATRWLLLSESVTSLSQTYSGILAFLKMETTTQAESLLTALESWRFAATTYFLWDVLGDLAQLSKAFQKSDLPIHRQFQLVTSTLRSLKATYLATSGPIFGNYFKKFKLRVRLVKV